MHRPADDSPTMVLKRAAPAWYWVRKNFSLASVLTILGILGTGGAYVISLKTRVVVIEREVRDIKEVVPASAAVATLAAQVEDHKGRIERLEKNWDDARETAGLAPYPRAPYNPPDRQRRGKP